MSVDSSNDADMSGTDSVSKPERIDAYGFDMWTTDEETLLCISTAREFGNWTRFLNHSCANNVDAESTHYGGHRAIVSTANARIEVGQQLFINYGAEFFERSRTRCSCAVSADPHVPSRDAVPRGVALPAVKSANPPKPSPTSTPNSGASPRKLIAGLEKLNLQGESDDEMTSSSAKKPVSIVADGMDLVSRL